MNNVVIRPALRVDYDQWLPLWDGYNAFYGRSGETALALPITKTTWERFFDPYEPMFVLVAEEDGMLLGLTHYLLHRSTTSVQPALYLQDLFTTADARGKGIGRALINAVYDKAREQGLTRIYWHTHETNQAAMKLYDNIADKPGFLMYRMMID